MRTLLIPVLMTLFTVARPPDARAQAAQSGAVLDLPALHDAAIASDPRSRQFALLQQQSELRLRNIDASKLPVISLHGLAQYQSDVPTAPGPVVGRPLFTPPKGTLDSYFRVEQPLLDPARGPQAALERAQLAEQQAGVRTALFGLRQQVNDAFFAAAMLQERSAALGASIANLEARLKEMSARVSEGTAIGAEAATIEAALLERRQDEAELRADRRAALIRLSTLTGRDIDEARTLSLPDLSRLVADARRAPEALRTRPEHEQFARANERIARQEVVTIAGDRPRISSFARLGYGRPGLNFISDKPDTYALAGLQLDWRVWNWGTASRERDALRLQQEIVSADQAAFARSLDEAIDNDEATIDRLGPTLELDQRIVTLREQIDRSTQVRLQEGVVTGSEYVDRTTELLQARLVAATHRVQLAEASARLLTTLGLEVR